MDPALVRIVWALMGFAGGFGFLLYIVMAFVVPEDEGVVPATTELDQLCLDRIARYKRPKDYRFVDSLPTNAYGKVLKRELRERLVAEGFNSIDVDSPKSKALWPRVARDVRQPLKQKALKSAWAIGRGEKSKAVVRGAKGGRYSR